MKCLQCYVSVWLKYDVHVTAHIDKFLIIKLTRCTNFSNLFLGWNSTCFGQFLCPSSEVFHCTHSNGICHTGLLTACKQDQDGTEQGYVSYRFADSLRAGSGWNWAMVCVTQVCWQLASRIRMELKFHPDPAVCTVKKSWWWTEELSETCRVSFQNKFEKLVYLVGFIIRNLVEIFVYNLNPVSDSIPVKYREVWIDTANRSMDRHTEHNLQYFILW